LQAAEAVAVVEALHGTTLLTKVSIFITAILVAAEAEVDHPLLQIPVAVAVVQHQVILLVTPARQVVLELYLVRAEAVQGKRPQWG
jgi:hypothetical protein